MSSFPMSEWMAHIASKTPLNRLSIPGTHDSLTFNVSNVYYSPVVLLPLAGPIVLERIMKFAQAQYGSANILKQLEYGCRYIDIRIDENLKGCHGPDYFGADCKNNLEDVMKDLKKFLTDHPREAVLMRLKNERGNVDANKVKDLVRKYGDIVWRRGVPNTNTERDNFWPLLNDVRGKVVFLDNLNGLPLYYDGYGIEYPFYENGKLKNYKVFNDPQDDYQWPDVDKKYKEITDNINRSVTTLMKVNHVSATGMGSSVDEVIKGFTRKTPGEYAEKLNPRVVNFLKSKGKCVTGLLIFDYITADIAKAVIDKNEGVSVL